MSGRNLTPPLPRRSTHAHGMGTAPKCGLAEGWEQTGRERERMLAEEVAARLLPYLNIPSCHRELGKQRKHCEEAGVENQKLLQAL